ncbi:hypothetical protein P7C73_g1892, partial [Tremellales sp. Uapishka_1]
MSSFQYLHSPTSSINLATPRSMASEPMDIDSDRHATPTRPPRSWPNPIHVPSFPPMDFGGDLIMPEWSPLPLGLYKPSISSFNYPMVEPGKLPFTPIGPILPPSPGTDHSHTGIRPHPHLNDSTIYINNVPNDLEEFQLAEALRECLPVRILLKPLIPDNEKLLPNVNYDWMGKSAEKALAILPEHPFLQRKPTYISPYPPPQRLPSPPGPVSIRYIQPTKLVNAPISSPYPNTTDALMATVPTPGQLHDAFRPWGSMREVSVWVEEKRGPQGEFSPDGGKQGNLQWRARVEFWYEDEARRFEVGWGQTGSLLKGWQLAIIMLPREPASYNPMPMPIIPLPSPNLHLRPQVPLPPTPNDFHSLPLPKEFSPESLQNHMGVMYVPNPELTPLQIPPPLLLPHVPVFGINSFPPDSPPGLSLTPPWAMHNMFSMPPRGRGVSRRGGRARTWSELARGESRVSGFVADDGTVIQHGPGQHIQPAPAWGPGSTSASGLVDLSNVFVKNLDGDITSFFLSDMFSNIGKIISARIMRDDVGKSRGYGFVSFDTPEEAAKAILVMNGARVGSQTISVTLHEPRKLRPEKIAEREAQGLPRRSSRQSLSPIRGDSFERGSRFYSAGNVSLVNTNALTTFQHPPATTDELRLLSPPRRREALTNRVSPRVQSFAHSQSIPEGYVEPTVKALVAHDLALIPLLHDTSQLDAKIVETLAVLQEDPDLNINMGIVSPISRPFRSVSTNFNSKANHRQRFQKSVEEIDPVKSGGVSDLLKKLPPLEIQESLNIQAVSLNHYAGAKNVGPKSTAQAAVLPASSSPSTESLPHPPLPRSSTPPSSFVKLCIKDATLGSLAASSSRNILENINVGGEELLAKLSITKIDIKESAKLQEWVDGLKGKTKLERRVEIGNRLATRVNFNAVKRSKSARIVSKLLNSEGDDMALCELMKYPVLLDQKIKMVMESSALGQ